MTDRWRIAFDAAPAREGSTGVGIYVRELALSLRATAPERIALIGVREGGPLDGALPGERDDDRFPFRGRGHLSWVQRYADDDARAAGASLVHYTNGLAPLRASVPFVVTIQDLTFIRYPLHHPPPRLARIPFAYLAAHRARLVVVPSRATERDVARILRVPRGRIAVVGYAPRAQLDVDRRDPDRPSIVDRLGLRAGGYVLAFGGLDARKNPERLVAALERLGPEHDDLHLVLAGADSWRHRLIRRRIQESPVRDRIIITGFLPDDDLAELLRRAALFAYVSLSEGFGLPILEAMAAGVPVITSRRSSMPEVAGGAAVLVDPRDVDEIAAGIRRALGERSRLVELGARRAAARTWADVAGEMLDVYRWALR